MQEMLGNKIEQLALSLLNQQCIKSCIINKKRSYKNVDISTVCKSTNFLKVRLCKPKMNVKYSKCIRS